jgi:hypothetical protein
MAIRLEALNKAPEGYYQHTGGFVEFA